jgi:hypothetical protein
MAAKNQKYCHYFFEFGDRSPISKNRPQAFLDINTPFDSILAETEIPLEKYKNA